MVKSNLIKRKENKVLQKSNSWGKLKKKDIQRLLNFWTNREWKTELLIIVFWLAGDGYWHKLGKKERR